MKIKPVVTKELFLELIEDMENSAVDFGARMGNGGPDGITLKEYNTAYDKLHKIIDLMFEK